MKTILKTRFSGATLFALPAALLACAGVHAQSLSFEPFTGYTIGAELPASTPSPVVAGYTGDWTAVDFGNVWPSAVAGSLIYTNTAGYAAGIGGHIGIPAYTGGIGAGNSGRMYRLLDSTTTVNSSTTGTIYLSFLYQNGQETTGTTYQMLDLYNGNTADANRTFTLGLTQNGGQSGNIYDFGVNEAYSNTGVAADTNVHLFVVKFNLVAPGNDTVTVWTDPPLGAGDPAGGVTVSGQTIAFDRLAISDYSGGSSGAWDEIRWGTTFNSVTIVAPPAPTVYQPTFGAPSRFAPVGQTIPVTVTINTNANRSNAVTLVLTNANPGVISLPGGNPTTLTFNAGATNVQVINASVIGTGVANITVVTNATFSPASVELGSSIFVTEEFAYPSGSENLITDGTGGTGFSGPWNTAGSVVQPGLTYESLVASSNCASVDQENSFRPLLGTYGGTGGGTVWVSFLVQGNETFPSGMYCGLSLFSGTSSENMFMGLSTYEANNGNWGFKSGNLYQSWANSVAPSTNVDFLVYRIDFPATNGGPATITFYADPAAGLTAPLVPTGTATVNNFTFDTLRIGEGGASTLPKNFDEIRLGTDWTNVVPFIGIPPPPTPGLTAPVLYGPIGQNLTVTLAIPTNVNASSTVNITVTNDNPAAFSLAGGNPASVTLTFAAGATNIQTFNIQVLATGTAHLTVVSNTSINTATLAVYSQISASESFLYPVGTLTGDSGGTGWANAWNTGTPISDLNDSVVSGLGFPSLLVSSNAVNVTGSPGSVGFVGGQAFRLLDKTYGGAGGGTVWVSFLINAAAPFAATENFGGISLFNGSSEQILLGLSAYESGNNGKYGFAFGGGGNHANYSGSVAPGNGTALLVYRLDFPTNAGGTVAVTLYADPTPGPLPPATSAGTNNTPANFSFNTIRLGCDNNITFDEIRFGSSWPEVLPFIANPTITPISGTEAQISWPTSAAGSYTLLSSPGVLGPWNNSGLSISTSGGNYVATDTIGGSAKFYRLLKQ